METSTKQQFIYNNSNPTATTSNNRKVILTSNSNRYYQQQQQQNHNNFDLNNNENQRYIYDTYLNNNNNNQEKFKMVDNKGNRSNGTNLNPLTSSSNTNTNNNNNKHEFIKSIKLIEKQIQSNTTINSKYQPIQQKPIQMQHQSQQEYHNEKVTTTHSNKNNENKIQPIWKSFIYDPNTSIYLVKREKIERFIQTKGYDVIAQRTKCKIQLYLNNDLSGTVYFTVSGTYESRCIALEQLRDETGKAGVIVNLPSLSNPLQSSLKKPGANGKPQLSLRFNSYEDYDTSSAQTSSDYFNYDKTSTSGQYKKTSTSNATTPTSGVPPAKSVSFKRTKSFHNKLSTYSDQQSTSTSTPTPTPTGQQSQYNTNNKREIISSNEYDLSNSNYYNNNNNNRRSYISSTSSSSSTSTSSSASSTPPSSTSVSPTSFQQKYSSNDSIKSSDNKTATQLKPTSNTTTNTSDKKRYTFEFLLSRADDNQSKQIPKNWPELNNKYPNICFCGRVISYFNPNKYQTYWDKIKQLNQHVHVATP